MWGNNKTFSNVVACFLAFVVAFVGGLLTILFIVGTFAILLPLLLIGAGAAAWSTWKFKRSFYEFEKSLNDQEFQDVYDGDCVTLALEREEWR